MSIVGGGQLDVVRWLSPPRAMTTRLCTSFCAQKGFSVAALQASFLCFCLTDNQVKVNLTKISDNDCQASCTGNTTEICGDVSMYSLFSTQIGMIFISLFLVLLCTS